MASRSCAIRLKNHQAFFMPFGGRQSRLLWSSALRFQSQLTQALSDAEKVAGHPKFPSMENVASHEISNMSVYLKKLMDTGHPLTATVERLISTKDETDLSRGLIVWLISQAAKRDSTEDILPEQKKLAEITQLIHIAFEIHSGIVNLETANEDLEIGNKMAILCGDFIQSRSSIQLAAFRNLKIIDLYGKAISECSASEFVELIADDHNTALDKWNQQTQMRYGTLLANACQASLIIGNNVELLQYGKFFGLELALAWQANVALQSYEATPNKAEHVLTKLFPGASIQEVVTTFQTVRNNHVDVAVKMVNHFPGNDANLALCNIARALKC